MFEAFLLLEGERAREPACAPGVLVVNIDNGYGAGVFAARVARRAAR